MKNDDSNQKSLRTARRITIAVMMLIVMLLSMDIVIGIGFYGLKKIGYSHIFYKFFDYRQEYFAFARNNMAFFSTFMDDYHDPIIGWNNPRSKHLKSMGCVGPWEAFYNDDGSRKIKGFSSNEPYSIICVGDSFTHGNETDDDSTFPACLQQISNVKVGNYGVGGYDVVQSVLQYENVLENVDPPVIGILGIMYENGRRNLNAFRPVYSNKADLYETFFFKPFFDGTQLKSTVIQSGENSFELSLQKADRMFTDDFWSKPALHFPYSISLMHALESHYFLFMAYQKLNRLAGNGMYHHDFNTPIIRNGISYCIKRFVEISRSHSIYPIIVFIPPNTQDLSSPNPFIAELQNTYGDAMILNFGNHTINWSEYIIREGCHPTPFGYKEIARFIHKHIHDHKLLPVNVHDG